MANVNKVLLIGNLTRDPELRFLPNQTAVAEFGLAVNRRWKTQAGEDREEVAFIDCSAFAKQAEVIAQWCKKGKPLFVEGRLKFDQWEDRQTQAKRSKLTVVVENFQFLGGKDDGEHAGGGRDGESTFDQPSRERQPATPRPPARSHRGPLDERQASGAAFPRAAGQAKAPAEAPFWDEQQFKEEDIPF
jgi:single-strand DNA-binding protein